MRAGVTEAEFKAAHKAAVALYVAAGWFTRRAWLQFLERRLGPDPNDALGRVFSELYIPLLEREFTRLYGGCARFQLAFNGPGTEMVWVRRGYMPERGPLGGIYTVKAEAMFAPMPVQPESEYYFLTPKGPAKLEPGGNIVMLTDGDKSWKNKLYTTVPASPAVAFAPLSEETRDVARSMNQLRDALNESIERGASYVDGLTFTAPNVVAPTPPNGAITRELVDEFGKLPEIIPSERIRLQLQFLELQRQELLKKVATPAMFVGEDPKPFTPAEVAQQERWLAIENTRRALAREIGRREVERKEFLFNAGKEAAAAWKDLTGEEVPAETWTDVNRAQEAFWKAQIPRPAAPPAGPTTAEIAALMRRALTEIAPGPAADRARELLAADADGTLNDDMMRQFVLEFPEAARWLQDRIAGYMLDAPPPASEGVGSLAIPRKNISARAPFIEFFETVSNPRPKPEVHVTRGPRRYFDDD